MDLHKEYNLIMWCAQYLNKEETNFVDISPANGNFTMILSQSAKYVYCYNQSLQDSKNVDTLINTLNLNNVILCSNTFKLSSYGKIGFIKMLDQSDEDCHTLLSDIKMVGYPPLICNNEKYKETLKTYGYDIYQLHGYDGMYFASNKYVSQQECESIIFNNSSTSIQISNALDKEFTCMKKIDHKEQILLNIPMKTTRVPNNPSILQSAGGYICNIRASNYVYDPHFRFLDNDNVHRSDHYIVYFDKHFMLQSMIPLVDKTDNQYVSSFVEGIDDLRLINENTFICSHGNFNNKRLIEQCLGTFNTKGEITKLIVLKGPDPHKHEKNWLAYEQNDTIYVIYLIHPFTVYQVDQETGNLTLVNQTLLTEQNCHNFRGSAPIIPYHNPHKNSNDTNTEEKSECGWLATTHQVSNSLSYYHRFVWFSADFSSLKISRPWYFEHKGIEFNPGMCHSHDPNTVIMSHSVLDNNAKCITITHDTIDAYFT